MSLTTPTLTAANSAITLTVPALLTTPFQLQGFSADNVVSMDDLESAETVIGVDGGMSAGWRATIKKQKYELQADSTSIAYFDTWWSASEAAREVYFASGVIIFPSLGQSWALNRGILIGYKPMPDAGTILKPRSFSIHWQSVLQSPSP